MQEIKQLLDRIESGLSTRAYLVPAIKKELHEIAHYIEWEKTDNAERGESKVEDTKKPKYEYSAQSFSLTKEQMTTANTFCGCEGAYVGATGGRVMYSFIPTSIGMIEKAKCSVCEQEVNLTDYSMW